MNKPNKTWHIQIKGVVQGVGYRPLVYAKAMEYGLNGSVKNGTNGLHIEINCDEALSKKFTHDISVASSPSLAIITYVHRYAVNYIDYQDFTINQDESDSDPTELSLTPDIALCLDCRNEIVDLQNRRFNYGFITCTNCGPRYSIINSLPYDRINTEMGNFEMCQSCKLEYGNPEDRRYFSQTNSCSTCGIQLSLYNQKRKCITRDNADICNTVIDSWRNGKIIAIKGIGGYLLTCDASNSATIESLRSWKSRPKKPLAVMYPDIKSLEALNIKTEETEALEGPASPIVLVSRKNTSHEFNGVCDGFDRIGVMIPYAPLFRLLLNQYKLPIVATSGNISGSPIIYEDEIAINELSHVADFIVSNNRKIVVPQDDSVIAFSPIENQKIILRRSRGMAPNYINNDLKLKPGSTLAMGAGLKSAFCLFKNETVHISQFIGDLTDYDTQKSYEQTLKHYLKLVGTKPEIILVDQHPNYTSTRIGLDLSIKWDLPTLSIQHHHAHFCALLGEHALLNTRDKVLGVIWDGTGLGTDDNIWGGEFFTYDKGQFLRCAHLAYSKHIGKDKMSREPRLSAFAFLGNSSYRESHIKEKFSETEWNIYSTILTKDYVILTSSMGRFFDAVASVLGITDHQSYQGEAASLLEVKAREYFTKADYRLDIGSYLQDCDSTQLYPQTVLDKIIEDMISNIPISKIAAKFHLTLVHWIRAVALAQNCEKIGFSGGVFQNSLLVDLIIISLRKEFELLFHQDLSPNDENISFGQLIYASIRK